MKRHFEQKFQLFSKIRRVLVEILNKMWAVFGIMLVSSATLTSGQEVSGGGSFGGTATAKEATFLGIPLSNLKLSSAGYSNLHAEGAGADLLGVHKNEGGPELTPEQKAEEAARQKAREEEFFQRNQKIQNEFGGGGAGVPPQQGFGAGGPGPQQFGGSQQFGAPAPGFQGQFGPQPGFGGPYGPGYGRK